MDSTKESSEKFNDKTYSGLKRFNGNTGMYSRHIEEEDSLLIGITGPRKGLNGLSICRAYDKPAIGALPAEHVALWVYPEYTKPKPEYRLGAGHANESEGTFQVRLAGWKQEQELIEKERDAWSKVNKEAIKVMKATFSEAGLLACGRYCDTATDLYNAYIQFASSTSLEDAKQSEDDIQAHKAMDKSEYFNNYYMKVKRYILDYYNCGTEDSKRFRDQLLDNVASVKRLAPTVKLCKMCNYDTKQCLTLLDQADRDGRRAQNPEASGTARLAALFKDEYTDDNDASKPILAAFKPNKDIKTDKDPVIKYNERACDNCNREHVGKCLAPCKYCTHHPDFIKGANSHTIYDCNHFRKLRGYETVLGKRPIKENNGSKSKRGNDNGRVVKMMKPCFDFQKGQCNRGNGCRFSHGVSKSTTTLRNQGQG